MAIQQIPNAVLCDGTSQGLPRPGVLKSATIINPTGAPDFTLTIDTDVVAKFARTLTESYTFKLDLPCSTCVVTGLTNCEVLLTYI